MKKRDAITSRIKIMARLDIAEKRLPQDGRINIHLSTTKNNQPRKSTEIDFRVSSLPTIYGEKIVMRLLDKSVHDMTKPRLRRRRMLARSSAITNRSAWSSSPGRPAPAKTTTLYSASRKLNADDVNIMTAEDPVEYYLPGINQVQVAKTSASPSPRLASFLRQDPDIIMVGEIRDLETAEIAMQAALTGHLVLSTLHTNDAPSTVNRLMNMGIEPFLVASSVNLICAQRLVRKVCMNCKADHPKAPQALYAGGFTAKMAKDSRAGQGRRLARSATTGYKGRVGLYEVMDIGEELREPGAGRGLRPGASAARPSEGCSPCA